MYTHKTGKILVEYLIKEGVQDKIFSYGWGSSELALYKIKGFSAEKDQLSLEIERIDLKKIGTISKIPLFLHYQDLEVIISVEEIKK